MIVKITTYLRKITKLLKTGIIIVLKWIHSNVGVEELLLIFGWIGITAGTWKINPELSLIVSGALLISFGVLLLVFIAPRK